MNRYAMMAAVGMAVAATLVAPAEPVWAGDGPVRTHAVSAYDATTTKTVVAQCGGTLAVYGTGARIVDGGGDVVLTAIEPNATLRTVTVSATARPGHIGSWSLIAYAVCDTATTALKRIDATGGNTGTADAICVGEGRVVGTGFRLGGVPGQSSVDELSVDENLTRVRVHVGPGTAASVTVYGICRVLTVQSGLNGRRLTASSPVDGYWPKGTVVGDQAFIGQVYGAGGKVTGGTGAHLTALVPDVENNLVTVQADRTVSRTATGLVACSDHCGASVGLASVGPASVGPASGGPASVGPASDEGSVAAHATLIGTFH